MFEEYLNNSNVRAFLDVLAYCEGANYNTVFGGGTFSGNQHPFRTVSAGGYRSDAAGRYQFLGSTWRSLQAQYHFPDFSPHSQDLGAIALIAQKGALSDLASGNLQRVVNAVKGVWPSLPGGHQQTRNWSQVTSYFQNDLAAQGGNYAGWDAASSLPFIADPFSNNNIPTASASNGGDSIVGAAVVGVLALLALSVALDW